MSGLIAHEWVARAGGSENVVDQFVQTFPDCDLQVLWDDAPGRFGDVTVIESWLAHTPLRRSKALALPFFAPTWRTIRARRAYEWILTSSHAFAHHARPRGLDPAVPKFSYVHTPARYIWEPTLDARGDSIHARLISSALKPLDRRRAKESERIAANSKFTRDRIQRCWDTDADVIYPPVDTTRIVTGGDWSTRLHEADSGTLNSLPTSFLLGASRFVSYKRLDQVIDAGVANDVPVVLAGGGPEQEALRVKASLAPVPVHFVNSPTDELLYALYQRAIAFVFPAIEDFGIMPVEAMAAGAPVIVAPTGGAAESLALAQGGAVVEEPTHHGWRAAVSRAASVDRADLPSRTSQFSNERFRSEISHWIGNS